MSAARARERLRQERIAFEQATAQCAQWFQLKLRFGYVALFVFAGIAALAASVLVLAHLSPTSIAVAAAMILGDALSFVVFVMKGVLQPNDAMALRPVTAELLPETKPAVRRSPTRQPRTRLRRPPR